MPDEQEPRPFDWRTGAGVFLLLVAVVFFAISGLTRRYSASRSTSTGQPGSCSGSGAMSCSASKSPTSWIGGRDA